MRWAAAVTVGSLVWTACGMADPARPLPIEPGQGFSLRPGESAQAPGAALRVGFEGVLADSRCPKGAQCVWAGDAIAQVWLQQGQGPRHARELRAAPGAAQAVRVLGHELRLLRLAPTPVNGKPMAAGDYVVTLMLSRGSASEPDR